jgi:hypothetical protein
MPVVSKDIFTILQHSASSFMLGKVYQSAVEKAIQMAKQKGGPTQGRRT